MKRKMSDAPKRKGRAALVLSSFFVFSSVFSSSLLAVFGKIGQAVTVMATSLALMAALRIFFRDRSPWKVRGVWWDCSILCLCAAALAISYFVLISQPQARIFNF